MRTDVFRSTPLRTTVILGVVFVLAILMSGVTSWYLINKELLRKLDASITGEFNVISQTFASNDITDLVDAINIHIKASSGADKIYYVGSASGETLAGNINRTNASPGWSTQPARALGLAGNDNYRVFYSPLGGNALLVGASFAETDQIDRIALTSFAWGTALLTVVIMAVGFVLAVRGQRRLAHISAAMARLGRGDLKARLAVSGRGDDIDLISSAMNHAIDRLGHSVESMRQVSVDIAHDLKTPLNRLAIRVYSAIEAENAGISRIEDLLGAEKEIRQINDTFDALLRIAQIEAGARRSRFASVDLGPLCIDLVDAYSGVAEEGGQRLNIEISSSPSIVTGDRDFLTQLFANLIENAIRHCQVGAHIELVAKDVGGKVVVEVSDDGPGIPADEYEAVFRRLYRVEHSRTTPGSGLGLSMVKAIAELHGAKVSLSNNNPGLRVIVEFPGPKSQLADL
jgi:signal transduction histidine kinase